MDRAKILRRVLWTAVYLIIGMCFAIGDAAYKDEHPGDMGAYEKFIGAAVFWPALVALDAGFEMARRADERRAAREAKR